jgi:carboxyl-terminal processing protease
MRRSESAVWILLIISGLVGSMTVSLARGLTNSTTDSELYRQLNLFGEVLERVRSDYVEKPDDSKLIEAAINGMLMSLDPHSYYLNPRELREMQVQTSGEFGGLGLEVTMQDGVIKVVSPIDGTPAARAGLRSGDLITSLDKKQVLGLTLQEAVDKMRGPPRAPITLTIVRKGVDHPIDVKLVRSVIHVIPVKYQAEDDVGYIYITSFNEQTTADLQKAIKGLKRQIGPKLKGFIIDLRNDPGGLLDQAIGVADAFLDQGTIVITKGREEMQRSDASPGDITDGKKLVVLINGGSASAAEIVAGALQDHHRASLVGTRSFGKGSVQTIIPLGSDGALMLTTARYYTPSGRSIQAKGIEPDVLVEEELPKDMSKMPKNVEGEANLRGHLRSEGEGNNSQEEAGSSSYVPPEKNNDTQLQYALELMRGVKSIDVNAGKKIDAN